MSKRIWNFVVCVLVITKSTFAVPLVFGDIGLSEFDIDDPDARETEVDDTIDIFSDDKETDDIKESLPQCGSNDCEVELNAEELHSDDFNTDLTSQEDIPTDTENETVEDPAEEIQKDLEIERKSRNEEILSKIETAILKSRSHDDDFSVMPVPEFVPIFKPRDIGVVKPKCDANNNDKIQPTASAGGCTKSTNPKENEDNKFVITGLYLKPITDSNPNVINFVTNKQTQNIIPTQYPVPPNTKTVDVNLNPNVQCGFPSMNQHHIPSITNPEVQCGFPSMNQHHIPSNTNPDVQCGFPAMNQHHTPLNTICPYIIQSVPTQRPVITLNQNQRTINMQTEPYNATPCLQSNHLNTQNEMYSRNTNLCAVDPAFANPNILFNANLPSKTNVNAMISTQATPCSDKFQLLNSNTIAADRIYSDNFNPVNQMTCSNTNLKTGKQLENQFIMSKNLASTNLLHKTQTSARNKPIVLFKPKTVTRHEICGDFLKKKTYTILVPFHTSKIV